MLVTLGCSSILTGGDVNEISCFSHCYGRLMKTIDVYRELQDERKMIICTGHRGEAENMKKFLVKNGIPEEKIFCESLARNTIENCLLSYKMINEIWKWEDLNLYLITDDYHMERSKTIFLFFEKMLNIKNKNLFLRSSFILDYISNPSPIHLQEIEKSYEKDKKIMKESLHKSLRSYL